MALTTATITYSTGPAILSGLSTDARHLDSPEGLDPEQARDYHLFGDGDEAAEQWAATTEAQVMALLPTHVATQPPGPVPVHIVAATGRDGAVLAEHLAERLGLYGLRAKIRPAP